MGGAVRVGDVNTGGGVVINGESSVLINGRPVATVGGHVMPHFCCGMKGCPPTHCHASIALGSTSVLAGGKPIARQGDSDTCFHSRATASSDVQVG